ncbi:MAG TPA: hypothetical protein VJN21_11300 [Candidatus Acidoferrales bacterium]|nr:hypothetical protein [Candidatus Acidoferrales bacterium]
MYVCRKCDEPINSASEVCPYCGAEQNPASAEAAPATAKKRRTLRAAVLLAIAIAGIWGIIWFATPMRMQNPRPVAEQAAVDALRALQKQLATYASGAGTFPRTIEALGEAAQESAREAMTGGYSLRYSTGQADASGSFHAYGLVALPRNYGYRSFYTDQTGVIRATRENRAATAQDPPM